MTSLIASYIHAKKFVKICEECIQLKTGEVGVTDLVWMAELD